MDEAFQKKILESIKKSGFPLELELVQKLREKKIKTFPNISFQDSERFNHELDIVSIVYGDKFDWKHGVSGIQLLIECKKAAKFPWVFFEEVHDALNDYGLMPKLDFCSDFFLKENEFNPLVGSINSDLANHHHNKITAPISRTYFEAIKEDNTSQIYKAVTNIFHGRRYLKNWFEKSRNSSIRMGRVYLNHFTIVLDGKLILATKDNIDFKIKEISHVILKTVDTLSNNNSSLAGEEIIIDVIAKDYFSTYLDLIENDIKNFNNHLDQIDTTQIKIK